MASVTGRRWRARFAFGSLLLHALLLSVGLLRNPRHLPAPAKLATTELEVEVLPPVDDQPPIAPKTVDEDAQNEPPHAARGASPPRAATIASQAGASTDAAPADPGLDVDAEAVTPPALSGPAAPQGPRLSLGQLGVGDQNVFLDRAAPLVTRAEKTARIKRRLDRALSQGMHDQDVAGGRGAGSPVMRSLEAAVYASTAPLNGNASFILIIDSDGKLLSSSVGEASGDREAWVRVARQAARALAARKLRVPKGKSVRLTVAVTSHLELPSGADPGVAVDVLGIPLSKGGGPRSTKVDLLNPLNPLAPLSLAGDPADIGQKARRMVRAHVVSEELL